MATPKLRFKEFDQKWGVDALQDQIDFLAGYAFDSKLMSNEPQKYQLIKMSNVYQNQLDLTRNPSYWTNIDSKIEKFLLKKGDIVLTLTGTVGKTDYGYNVEIDKDDKFLLNQRLVRLRAKQDLSDSKFIQYRISTDKFFYHFFYSSKGGTGNQSNVSIEDLKLLELNFPSKEEQTKIASFLSAVDEKISQLTQKHELLSQYKQGMMQKLFSQEIRFKADDGSEFGEWEERKLSEISQKAMYGMNAAATEYDGINKYLRITDICEFSNSFKKDNLTSPNAELFDRYKLQLGDLLFARTGASVGKSYLYREDDGITYFAGFLIRFSLNTNLVIPYFIFLQTLIKEFCQWVVTNSMRSGQPGINAEEYSSYIFKVPCLEEQTKIANFLSSIDQKIEVVAQQIEQAKTWKKGLLQQMFV